MWHLHLTYTRSYWDRFCGEVLGQTIHHGPTKGGPDEAEKFDRWYQKTLESYQRVFGEEPHTDIWPARRIRCFERRRAVRSAKERAKSEIPAKNGSPAGRPN